ncbi:MAG: magnesium transporter [Deltaproteobacteria bacterium]|nr:magnesium transporter [Deltaproteobacteria bacterium]
MEEFYNTLQNLEKLIEQGREIPIITLLSTLHPADIAELIDALEDDQKKKLFGLLDIQTASDVISEIDDISRELILEDIPNELLTKIVDDMESDDAIDLIADLPEKKAQEILAQIEKKDSEAVQQLLKYSEDTAGGIMQTELISVNEDMKIQEAIERIRAQAKEAQNFQNVFVTAKNGQLVGIVSLRKLILAKPDARISEIMVPHPISVTIDVDQEEVANIFKKYDFISLPVVDHKGKLVGQILVDDIIDVFEEEASEDMLRMAGTGEEELVYSGKTLRISRARIPWLLTNLCGGIVTGYFLWLFRITVKDVLALITFIPVITAMGGNVGIQTSTIMVRGIAIKKIQFEKMGDLLFREMKVGAIIGLTCGVVAGVVAYFWHGKPLLGLVVAVAMFLAIGVASLIGTVTPAFFKKVHVDPALASGPIVATIVDITGIVIYMGIATLFLKFLV